MGKLENKRDLSPYRNLKTRLEIICLDPRYAFMFGSVTVYDSMAQILGRIFRVPVNDKPITILELTGLPTEIINVVVSVLCRMTFDFALWSEGKVPVTLVCEEAHRYVPAKPNLGFEPCKRAIAKIAKEGRKYGASLCIVTQRPAEIDPTILSQCNTVFALRMSNDRDQEIVKSAIADTGSGLLEFLTALGQREAIAFGDGVTLPVRIKFDELPKHCMPQELDRPLHREVAAVGRRRGLPRGHRRALAQLIVRLGRRCRPAHGDVRRGHEHRRAGRRGPGQYAGRRRRAPRASTRGDAGASRVSFDPPRASGGRASSRTVGSIRRHARNPRPDAAEVAAQRRASRLQRLCGLPFGLRWGRSQIAA